MDGSDFGPFLYFGVMFACFQMVGILPSVSVLLKNAVRMGVMSCAVCCKNLGCMLSGPGALCGLSDLRCSSTSSSVVVIVESGCWVCRVARLGGSCVCLVKTLVYCSFSVFAFSVSV